MSIRENHIVVGVDGSDEAIGAALWAAGEAAGRNCGLHLIYAFTDPISLFSGSTISPEINDEEAHQWADALLAAAISAVHRLYPTMDVTSQIQHAHPVSALTEAAEHSLFTVVGRSGADKLEGFFLGSVTARLAGHATGPVLVIPEATAAERGQWTGSVVVGLDGSAPSNAALAFAFEEASLHGVGLVAVRAWNDTAFNRFAKIFPLPVDRGAIRAEETRLLAEQLAGWVEKYPDVPVRRIVHGGSAVTVLLRECVDIESSGSASLLVVGSRGRGAVTGLLLGSTSQALLAQASCPVAVLREDHIS